MALEWLKPILGDGYTEEIDKAVSEQIGKGFVARADFNELKESKKSTDAQLAEANKTIESLQAADKDIEAVRKKLQTTRPKPSRRKKMLPRSWRRISSIPGSTALYRRTTAAMLQ